MSKKIIPKAKLLIFLTDQFFGGSSPKGGFRKPMKNRTLHRKQDMFCQTVEN